MSAYEETLVLVRLVTDGAGLIEDVQTFEEYEEWMDTEWDVRDDDPLMSHEEVENFLGRVSYDLDEFFEMPASLVERLRDAKEEYAEALDEVIEFLDEDDE